jgi:hypothetical protein
MCYGVADVLDVSYWKKNGKVVIRIRLKPSVEKQIFGGDGSRDREGGH